MAARTIRRLRVGRALKDLRQERGLTLEEAAKLFDRTTGSLSKIENGQVRIYPRDLHAYYAVYEVTDEETRGELLTLVRRSLQPVYAAHYGEVIVDGTFADYLSLEQDADTIGIWTETIPGLLQTRRNAIQVVEAGQVWQDHRHVEKFVDLRIERQAVLTRTDPPPPKVWVVMGERAIRQASDPDVQREQLEHLVDMTRLSNLSVQILPFKVGPHPGDNGPFKTMTFPSEGDPSVVIIESLASALIVEDPSTYERYQTAGEQLRMAALSPKETLTKINEVIEEL
jgi:transcriptional regulator with XRE-family HTH domain